jgi:hypothetical protein
MTLKNPKRERFAQAYAAGTNAAEAAVKAGYSPNGAKQTGYKLVRQPEIVARVQELGKILQQASGVDAAWVAGQLRTVYEVSMQMEPLFDVDGNRVGERIRSLPTAVRALELLGKLASVGAFGPDQTEVSVKVRVIDLAGEDVPTAPKRIGRMN